MENVIRFAGRHIVNWADWVGYRWLGVIVESLHDRKQQRVKKRWCRSPYTAASRPAGGGAEMDSDIFRDADGTYNKRLLGLVLLVLLAVVGAGVGTLGLTDNSDATSEPATETTTSPTESTPDGTDATSTESGGSASPPPSSLLSETPTETPTSNQSDGNAASNTTAE